MTSFNWHAALTPQSIHCLTPVITPSDCSDTVCPMDINPTHYSQWINGLADWPCTPSSTPTPTIPNRDHLNEPDQSDHEEEVTVCQWQNCNLFFQTCEALGEHIERDHVQSGKKKYFCEWLNCSRAHLPFTKRHKVCNHVRTHTGERPYVCPEPLCQKKFSRQDTLAVHARKHVSVFNRSNLVRCPVDGCKKVYQTHRALSKHISVHHPEIALSSSPLSLSSISSSPLSMSIVPYSVEGYMTPPMDDLPLFDLGL